MLWGKTSTPHIHQGPGHDSHHVLQETTTGNINGYESTILGDADPVYPAMTGNGTTVSTTKCGKIMLTDKICCCLLHGLQVKLVSNMPGGAAVEWATDWGIVNSVAVGLGTGAADRTKVD